MTSPLDPLTVQRLAFIRFLYEQGLSPAGQPDPLSATAVLSFHDAVEAFLRLAAEHLKVSLPTGINFADYWTKIQPHLPVQVELPSKNPMDRMNKLRVQLKHHGTIPSRTAIEQTRGDVTTFFTDATQMVFGIDFATVDLIDMVTRKETARALRDAQTHAESTTTWPRWPGLSSRSTIWSTTTRAVTTSVFASHSASAPPCTS